MRELAALAGVSVMTVSLAMRGGSGLKPETTEHIRALAAKHGYRPNPNIARLMSLVRSKRRRTTGVTLAYLNNFPRRELAREVFTFRAFHEGATARAAELGYQLREFWTREPGLTARRLGGILKSRGIEGVLVGPRWFEDPLISLDWEEFYPVVVGDVDYDPKLTRISSHRFHGTILLLDELSRRDYRKIACVIWEDYDRAHDHDTGFALRHYSLLHPKGPKIVPMIAPRWEYDSFAKNFARVKPDAVVSLHREVFTWLGRMGLSVPDDVGYANLDAHADTNWCGVDQMPFEVGRRAVDLAAMLLAGEVRGVPDPPSLTLIEGRWREGTTLRAKPLLR
jgi:LacI family transcriptional regulator